MTIALVSRRFPRRFRPVQPRAISRCAAVVSCWLSHPEATTPAPRVATK